MVDVSEYPIDRPNTAIFGLARCFVDLLHLVSCQEKFGSTRHLLGLFLATYPDDGACNGWVCQLPCNDDVDHRSVVGSGDSGQCISYPGNLGLVLGLSIPVVSPEVLGIELPHVEVVG